MELMLDTADLSIIDKYNQILPLSGVTTNPSIIKKAGKMDYFSHMRDIRKIIGPEKSLHAQVVAQDYQGMMKDAETLLKEIDRSVFIKVPVTETGLAVIRELKKNKVHVTATAVYSKFQAYLAIAAHADYVAPYFNRMENQGVEAAEAIYEMIREINRTDSSTKILAASFKNIRQVNSAVENGAQAVTIGADLIDEGVNLASVDKAVNDFQKDWLTHFEGKQDVFSLLK